MIERVLKGRNIRESIRQTMANKGSSGVDRMPVSELESYFEHHQDQLFTHIHSSFIHPSCHSGSGNSQTQW